MTNEEIQKNISLQNIERNRRRREERRRKAKRTRRISAAVLAGLCIAAVCIVYNSYLKEIDITEINEFNGTYETKTIKTRVDNVSKLFEENGVVISDTDRVSVPIESPVNDRDSIVITRGKNITIKTGDGEKTVTSTKADPKDALIEAGYVPDETDIISSENGNVIELTTVDEDEEIINEPIPHETEYVDDSQLLKGTEEVRTEGSDGNIEKKYKVVYENNAEISRELISETVTAEAVNTVIARGTKEAPPTPKPSASGTHSTSFGAASEGDGTIDGHSYSRKIRMTATAYSTSAHENGGYTVSAVGNPLRYGIVAIDPSIIPLGSTVYVTSTDGSWTYGIASAEDTGGAIKGNRIDLCYESESETRAFGRQSCIVYVLD